MSDNRMEQRLNLLESQIRDALQEISEHSKKTSEALINLSHQNEAIKRLNEQQREFGSRLMSVEKEQARREYNDKLVSSINSRVWFLVIGAVGAAIVAALKTTL